MLKAKLLALVMLACGVSSVFADEGATVVSVSVVHFGQQMVKREVVMRDGGHASFGTESVFPVGHANADGSPLIETVGMTNEPRDFAGSWNLLVRQVIFDPAGDVSVQASLDEHAAGAKGVHQELTLSIRAGEHVTTIHGANGDDYLLSVRHVIYQAG